LLKSFTAYPLNYGSAPMVAKPQA